jgi:hypothetical protein
MAGSRKTTPLAQAAMTNRAHYRDVDPEFDLRYPLDESGMEFPATPRVIDWPAALKQPTPDTPRHIQKFIDDRPTNDEDKLLTAKRIRARARRAARRGETIPKQERDMIWKPIEDWDIEELARGKPRNANGDFRGKTPAYVTREVHEQAMDLFKRQIRLEMNGKAVDALMVLSQILGNDEVDEKGRPLVAAGTKLDGAKFLIEHVIGKAVQPTTNDISVKLQGILGMALVNPTEDGYDLAHVGNRGGTAMELTASQEDYEDAEVIWSDDDDGL